MSATRTPPQLTLVVAATLANGIGVRGGLPWRLPREMAYFARVTKSGTVNNGRAISAVVMGRKSWESIPLKFRPLRDRLNVVISSQKEFKLDQPVTEDTVTPPPILASSLEEALAQLSTLSLQKVFIIGGASLYTQALEDPSTTGVLLTRVLEPAYEECDAFFPDIRADDRWTRASHSQLVEWVGFDVPEGVQEEKGTKYEFQFWIRKEEGRKNNSM